MIDRRKSRAETSGGIVPQRSATIEDDRRGRRLSEADLERYGTDLLALDGWRTLKTDPVSDKSRGKGFGEKGMADRLYLRYGYLPSTRYEGLALAEVLWIEWKRRGGRAEPHQQAWHAVERARGALVLLAGDHFEASPEGFLAWYRASGLMRREIR